jgi:hypothetical protein
MNFPYERVWPAVEGFTLAHRELAAVVAAEFAAVGAKESAAAWRELAARIERALVGEFAQFSKSDAVLVSLFHRAILRDPLADGARARSRELTSLGVAVVLASRGQFSPVGAR